MRKRNRPCFKLKNLEEHYLQLLQLYMPWRNEDKLKQDSKNYGNRCKKVEDDILCNITKHEPYLDMD